MLFHQLIPLENVVVCGVVLQEAKAAIVNTVIIFFSGPPVPLDVHLYLA
jgi:hypothetical protein